MLRLDHFDRFEMLSISKLSTQDRTKDPPSPVEYDKDEIKIAEFRDEIYKKASRCCHEKSPVFPLNSSRSWAKMVAGVA